MDIKIKLNEYLYILQLFLDRDVQDNQNYATLFRNRSTVIDMIKYYSVDNEYKEYLKTVILAPILNELNSSEYQNHTISLESFQIYQLTEFVLKRIYDNFPKCPLKILYTSNMLKRHVSPRYPDHWKEIIGGYFFLRVVCPALTTPKLYFNEDEWLEIENQQKRKTFKKDLLEIAKLLQQLSNSINNNNNNNNNKIVNNNENINNQKILKEQQIEKISNILEEISSYQCKFIDEKTLSLTVEIFDRIMKEAQDLIEKIKSELINGNKVEIKRVLSLERILLPIRETFDLAPSNNDFLVVIENNYGNLMHTNTINTNLSDSLSTSMSSLPPITTTSKKALKRSNTTINLIKPKPFIKRLSSLKINI